MVLQWIALPMSIGYDEGQICGLDFIVNREKVGILGANGCGKTTYSDISSECSSKDEA
jgi:ABC-type multidrug transport system ATPase subunit